MNKTFILKPFTKTNLSVEATLELTTDMIDIHYKVHDPKSEVIWPKQSQLPEFRDKLYEQTCFEFFLKPKIPIHPSVEYIEWNFSPSFDWACWLFSGYRSLSTENYQNYFEQPQISATSLFKALIPNKAMITNGFINLSCILNTENAKHYFAIEHGTKPDFHDQKNFYTL